MASLTGARVCSPQPLLVRAAPPAPCPLPEDSQWSRGLAGQACGPELTCKRAQTPCHLRSQWETPVRGPVTAPSPTWELPLHFRGLGPSHSLLQSGQVSSHHQPTQSTSNPQTAAQPTGLSGPQTAAPTGQASQDSRLPGADPTTRHSSISAAGAQDPGEGQAGGGVGSAGVPPQGLWTRHRTCSVCSPALGPQPG